MNLPVEHIDSNGRTNDLSLNLTRIAFIKHMAFAGQGFAPSLNKFIRTLGMFFNYNQYIRRQAFNGDHFSVPPLELSDPTEKGQFSNLAGKAIADFLSKQINDSFLTANYEAGMRLLKIPVKGKRPDLISFTPNSVFAIEAKGYTGGFGNMATHKAQSKSGKIKVNFSMACVSYNMYNQIQCKYHDPYNDNIPYDEALLSNISKQYYSGVSEFINEKYFEIYEANYQGELFYELGISYRKLEKYFYNELPPRPFWFFEMVEFYRPRIIITKRVREFAQKGISRTTDMFGSSKQNKLTEQQDQYFYIDNDGIGLKMR